LGLLPIAAVIAALLAVDLWQTPLSLCTTRIV
jgi:hypothetical protein